MRYNPLRAGLFFLAVEIDKQQHRGKHNEPVGFAKADGDHLVDADN